MDTDTIGLGIGVGVWAIFVLVTLVITLWIWWRIVSRTGYSGWLALLILVPLANFVFLLVLAFGRWPIEDELARLRAQVASG